MTLKEKIVSYCRWAMENQAVSRTPPKFELGEYVYILRYSFDKNNVLWGVDLAKVIGPVGDGEYRLQLEDETEDWECVYRGVSLIPMHAGFDGLHGLVQHLKNDLFAPGTQSYLRVFRELLRADPVFPLTEEDAEFLRLRAVVAEKCSVPKPPVDSLWGY